VGRPPHSALRHDTSAPPEQPKELAAAFERGALRVHVGQVFPFEQIAAAHARLEQGHAKGKLVLTPH
jgi:NADPH:quinone reductase-like Zn-dependent oxidoreductase